MIRKIFVAAVRFFAGIFRRPTFAELQAQAQLDARRYAGGDSWRCLAYWETPDGRAWSAKLEAAAARERAAATNAAKKGTSNK